MIDRPHATSVFQHEMALSSKDMTQRMHEIARLQQQRTDFRHNMPDITGQENNDDVRIKHRYKLYNI